MYLSLISSLFFIFIATSSLFGQIEHSIIGTLDHYHLLKNIDAKKYSQNQYKAIRDALSQKEGLIRIMSYNMLFDRYDHLLPPQFRWPERVTRIVSLIEEIKPDIICFQELYPKQVNELLKEIGGQFGFAGQFPEATGEPIEVNGILYRKSRFQCQEVKLQYISDTPEDASPDPFSSEPRTLSEAHLFDWITHKELAVFCAHASFISADSREYAARFIAKHVETVGQQKPVILGCDFNSYSPKVDDPLLPYYDATYLLKILTSKSLRNARDTALIGTLGPLSTYTNREGSLLPFQGTGTPGVFLDHIFVGGQILVLLQAVEPAIVNGLYASDHMPVIADCINFH